MSEEVQGLASPHWFLHFPYFTVRFRGAAPNPKDEMITYWLEHPGRNQRNVNVTGQTDVSN